MQILGYKEWSESLNESSKPSSCTMRDIWRGYCTLHFGDRQIGKNSPLYLIQARLVEILNSDQKTRDWVSKNGFKPDNDFGKMTANAIGLATNGKIFSNPTNLAIGPNTLKKLGFKEPPTYTFEVKALATTLAIESGDTATEDEIKAIANIIANRRFAINKYRSSNKLSYVDIVMEPSQFSLWNAYQSKDREKMVDRAMKGWRPENRKNWGLAVKYARLLLKGADFKDNTGGATHYYNPEVASPDWANTEHWVDHKLNLIHKFGRDTLTNWSKNPVKRASPI